jgi:hypothetical protein
MGKVQSAERRTGKEPYICGKIHSREKDYNDTLGCPIPGFGRGYYWLRGSHGTAEENRFL